MCWWVKTKSAPLPERPCEQLTCCEKIGSVQGNYINCVKKRHNCRITGKTKATCHGGHLTQAIPYPQRMSMANNATFAAGGQILSCSVITGTTALSRLGYAQLFVNSISQARRNISSLSFEQSSFFSKHVKRKATTINKTAQSTQILSFDIFYPYDCRRDSPHHGAGGFYSDSLALRRWRRLISPRMAVTINCAVLSPVSFTCSIASTTSCGARACNFCDLLLIWSLSISGSLCDYWNPVYTKKTKTKRLKWIPLSDYTGIQLSVYHSMQTRLKRIAVLSQPLTTNDSNSIEVAMRNHITHPQGRDPHNLNKYIWRFIALSTAQPRVITIEATSEQEARQQSPDGCVMVFAARIRQGVGHVQ
ncbi:host cell division inhibitor Icd-like protein [Escherichia coli]|nr:host cell division inhibitor Icd-like protein [Escherichia coli]EEU5794953.1 host cell division inhibitor Icd-like protein [Escherichia coli]EEY1786371.1 host cell division inhibitor Icd-like protein [Escherichia coli]EFA5991754.1 host cell division inhibitor Icd-like protein [Escherichia coli]EFE2676857.1 host cell division inhibitor Icd-like protein [Escherichia coli]